MNVLLIGSGGREHAIAWKLFQSPLLKTLYIAPGNPGTAEVGINIDINPLDFEKVKEVVLSKNIELVVVGPEDPLVNGIHDFFINNEFIKHIPVIGPCKAGAMLEGSKDFAKGFMVRHGIPTAAYKSFSSNEKNAAYGFLESLKPPYVLKADGLAAGKGVIICDKIDEAKQSLNDFFDGKFGKAGETVVIEEFLRGIELSVFVLTDGESYVILPEAKDYKRIGEGDTGPNTGGMGSVSPVPFANETFMQKVEERIVKPTVAGLKLEGIPYLGFIFVGLMNVDGDPYVIEYNARMGDPETQVVMPRIKSDFLEILVNASKGKLGNTEIEFNNNSVSAVILVSGGYPGSYQKGKEISKLCSPPKTLLFHAGTKVQPNGKFVTSGGRVFAAVGISNTLTDSLEKAYAAAKSVDFEGVYYRKDIGQDLLKF